MNRRQFLGGLIAGAAGLVLPDPERRVWALDRTMIPRSSFILHPGDSPLSVATVGATGIRWREHADSEWESIEVHNGRFIGWPDGEPFTFEIRTFEQTKSWSGPLVNGRPVHEAHLVSVDSFYPDDFATFLPLGIRGRA